MEWPLVVRLTHLDPFNLPNLLSSAEGLLLSTGAGGFAQAPTKGDKAGIWIESFLTHSPALPLTCCWAEVEGCCHCQAQGKPALLETMKGTR